MNQTAVSIFSAVGVVLALGGLMVTEHNALRAEINGLLALPSNTGFVRRGL